MSQTVTLFRIMIASPSDVSKERQATVEAISRWNSQNSFDKKAVILPLCWELDAPLGVATDAQDIIDQKLVAISDMVIGIFRSKLGRKSPKFTSYTIGEIRGHTDNGKQALLFFGPPSRATTVKSSQDQTKLLKFKTDLKKNLGKAVLYQDYTSLADFKANIYARIEKAVNDYFLSSTAITRCFDSIPSFNDVVVSQTTLTKEQEFLLVENAQFIPVAQNGNDRAILLSQDNHVVDVDINFESDPSYGPCSFVSAVAQFAPPLNWEPLRDTNTSLMLRLISEDESVTSATIEVKATDRRVKCFENAYCLEHGRQDVVIKLSDIKNPSLINEIVEICIVIRPNQVPSHKGHLRIDVMGLCD